MSRTSVRQTNTPGFQNQVSSLATSETWFEFVRPAAEPTDFIKDAADTLAKGAAIAAHAIIDAAELNTPVGVSIAEKLRQPWPTGHSEDPKQSKADEEARLQTANMATTMIINALAYQQNLDGYAGIKGLAQIRDETVGKRPHQRRGHCRV